MDCFFIVYDCRVRETFSTFRFSRFLYVSFFQTSTFRFAGFKYYTYSATNIRLQEASIGYTFKKNQLFGIGDLTLSLVGRNLFFFYCKAPFDPESTASTGNYYQGIDKFMTPSTRTLGFNIKLKF